METGTVIGIVVLAVIAIIAVAIPVISSFIQNKKHPENPENSDQKPNDAVEEKYNDSPIGTSWLKFLIYFRYPAGMVFTAISLIFTCIILINHDYYNSFYNGYHAFTLLQCLIMLPLTIFVFLNMKRKNESGYNSFFLYEIALFIFNFLSRIIYYSCDFGLYTYIMEDASSFALKNYPYPIAYALGNIFGTVLGFAVWAIPNFIYIKKRKFLFVKGAQYSQGKQETKNESESSENAEFSIFSKEQTSYLKEQIKYQKEYETAINNTRLNPKYCNNCGQPLNDIGFYCLNCGAKKPELTKGENKNERY